MSGAVTGIRGVSYALPKQRYSLSELETLGKLESDPALLEQFGFSHVYAAEEETPYAMALAAATALLNEHDVPPTSVDTLLYCGTPSVAFARAGCAAGAADHIATTRRFQYPATRLQYDLGLECASTARSALAAEWYRAQSYPRLDADHERLLLGRRRAAQRDRRLVFPDRQARDRRDASARRMAA